ncbi:hypothetical protein KL946_001610, partial [Ogataea haglerorum]
MDQKDVYVRPAVHGRCHFRPDEEYARPASVIVKVGLNSLREYGR